MLNIQSLSKDTEQQFPFLKKHVKAPKVHRVKLSETIARNGWNSCSSFDCETGEGTEYTIVSSPSKNCKASSDEENSLLSRKPKLVEISNIQTIFEENKCNSYKDKDLHKKSHINFPDFAQNVYSSEKSNKIYQQKRFNSGFLNIQGMQTSFKAKKLKSTEGFENYCCKNLYAEFSLDNNQKSKKVTPQICINKKKFHKLNESFLEYSTCTKYVKKPLDSETSVIHEYNLVNDEKTDSVIAGHLKGGNLSKFQKLTEVFDNSKSETFLINDCSTVNISSSKSSKPLYYGKNASIRSVSLKDDISKFETLTEGFIVDHNMNTNNNGNSDSDTFSIENESSPINKCKWNYINLKNHHKFQNLTEIFTRNSTSEQNDAENSNYCDTPIVNNECSPVNKEKSGLKKTIHVNDINQNTFLKLSESFICNSARNENLNKKNSFEIKNEISPEKNHSLKAPLNPSMCFSTFENNTDNFLCEQESSNVIESITFDNKTFVQLLQSDFQNRSLPSDKGSIWLQSLHCDNQLLSRDENYENDDNVGKKIRRNIRQGGFVEQMLKLQRKERLEKAIWNHKMNEMKKKAGNNCITLILRSVFHLDNIVVTKCSLSDTDNENIQSVFHSWNFQAVPIDDKFSAPKTLDVQSCSNALQNKNCSHVFVLFKRTIFSKLHLKISDMFAIYPPWQTMYLPSLKTHAILCTYFVDSLHKSADIVQSDISVCQSLTDISHTVQAKRSDCDCDISACLNNNLLNSSDLFGKSLCISARIQRIWENGILDEKVQNIYKIKDYMSFTLLLQAKDGTYLEIKVSSNCMPQTFIKFLSEAEGGCFTFYCLKVSHRYNLKKHSEFLKVIESIQNEKIDSTVEKTQRFYYQFIPSSFSKIPEAIAEEEFPVYQNFEINPLSVLQKNSVQGVRFSCIGKILFQKKDDIYISDESLLCSKFRKYYKVKILNYFKTRKKLNGGSIVLIKEAVVNEDYLFVDQFSRSEIISSDAVNKVLLSYQLRLIKISLISFEHVLTSLSTTSNIEEFVLMKGVIIHVDEDSAISWLECSFCSKENLLQDSNSVIYCEDCACIVEKPVLKVKMDVTVLSSSLPNTEIKIQLLSSTVKKILKINEDDSQFSVLSFVVGRGKRWKPQCNIADVLGKDIGAVPCCVRNIEFVNSKKVFHLTEVTCY